MLYEIDLEIAEQATERQCEQSCLLGAAMCLASVSQSSKDVGIELVHGRNEDCAYLTRRDSGVPVCTCPVKAAIYHQYGD